MDGKYHYHQSSKKKKIIMYLKIKVRDHM